MSWASHCIIGADLEHTFIKLAHSVKHGINVILGREKKLIGLKTISSEPQIIYHGLGRYATKVLKATCTFLHET